MKKPNFPLIDPLVINSMREHALRQNMQRQDTNNFVTSRLEWARGTVDPRRDLAAECGYPPYPTLNAHLYKDMYDTDPIATRVIELYPKESWQSSPAIFESEDPNEITPFEEAWYDLQTALRGEQSWYQDEEGSPIWEQLCRVDVLSGIGFFGVLLLGIDDNKNLDQPVDGVATMVPVGRSGQSQQQTAKPRGAPGPKGNAPGKTTKLEFSRNRAGEVFRVRVRNTGKAKHAPTRPTPELTVNRQGVPFSEDNGDEPVGGWPVGHPMHQAHAPSFNVFKGPAKPVPPKHRRAGGGDGDTQDDDVTQAPGTSSHTAAPPINGRGKQPGDVDAGGDSGSRSVPGTTMKPGLKPMLKPKAGQTGPPRFTGATRPMEAQSDAAPNDDGSYAKPFQGGDTDGRDSGYGQATADDTREGTDRQYSNEISEPPPSSFSGVKGTDAQYTGVELSPPEYPDNQPSTVQHQLLFLRPYDESLVQIVQYEADLRNPRFGQPVMYRITLNDPKQQHSGIGLPLATVRVHWSRIIHIADNLGSSEIFGYPRLQQTIRPTLDAQKIRGASPEGYWKTCFTGLSFETHPELGGDVEIDRQNLAWQIYAYNNTLQRDLVTSGMSVKTISPQLVDPTPHNKMSIEAICIKLGCPVRVFMGSERGELASSQDDSAWNDRVTARRNQYITPRIIVPFIDRLIAMGVLPTPTGYSIRWPDLDSTTDKDKAQIMLTRTQALGAYVSQGVEAIIPPKVYLTEYDIMTDEQAMDALDEASKSSEGAMGAAPMTMPQKGDLGHPATEEEPPKPPILPGTAPGAADTGMDDDKPESGPDDPRAAGGQDANPDKDQINGEADN